MIETDDFWEWLDFGTEKGWISKISCVTHDFVEMTDEEAEEYQLTADNCIPTVRVYGQEIVF